MSTETILQEAQKRAQAAGKRHAGDLTPEEAHTVLGDHPKAILVDVRSHPELDFSG
ncbi:rhodanese-like domain-containing protein, partial [Acidithiobacillus ferrooxidans]|nr:rhodanese-like domain-containing protein [Acidithiobacillus ferrooxidans]